MFKRHFDDTVKLKKAKIKGTFNDPIDDKPRHFFLPSVIPQRRLSKERRKDNVPFNCAFSGHLPPVGARPSNFSCICHLR